MFCKHPSGYCPNGCELNCMGEEPTTKGVVVSAWEGSKFQEAVEAEKKSGRKRPEAKPVTKAPPTPKYKIGDTIEWKPDWDDKPHIHTIKFIRIERFAHATTIVYGCHTTDKYVDQLVDEPTITATLTRSPT